MLEALVDIRRQVQRSKTRNARDRAATLEYEIHHLMETWIVNGLVGPAERLPAERDVVAATRASRRTVRNVLARLEKDRLVRRRIGAGTFAAPAQPKPQGDYRRTMPAAVASGVEVLEARLLIEPAIGALACERAHASDLRNMRRAVGGMQRAPDLLSFKKAGYDFHREIARSTRNPLIIAMYDFLVMSREEAGWSELVEINETRQLRRRQTRQQLSIFHAIAERDAGKVFRLHEEFLRENIAHARGGIAPPAANSTARAMDGRSSS